MIDVHVIEEVKKILVKIYNPLVIYIFGSYVWGCPDKESDLDLLVIVEKYTKDRHQTLVDGRKALIGLYVPKDILVYNKEEWNKFSENKTKFCYKVRHEGKLIYGKA